MAGVHTIRTVIRVRDAQGVPRDQAFTIEIDSEAVARWIGPKVLKSKAHRGSVLGGAVVVRPVP